MDKYNYTYENDDEYCYPNTNILKNKLNITNDKDLYEAERELVAYQTTNLVQKPIKGNFDFEHLKSIHECLFGKIYTWAGIPRKCNIAKTNLFCLAQYIDNYSKEVFDKVVKNDYFIKQDYNEKIESLAILFADINALHPFREGNGRSQREFIKGLALINGVNLDFTKVMEKEMIIASSESTNGNIKKLLAMFKKIASSISKEEQLKYIDEYIKDKKIKDILKSNVK